MSALFKYILIVASFVNAIRVPFLAMMDAFKTVDTKNETEAIEKVSQSEIKERIPENDQ